MRVATRVGFAKEFCCAALRNPWKVLSAAPLSCEDLQATCSKAYVEARLEQATDLVPNLLPAQATERPRRPTLSPLIC